MEIQYGHIHTHTCWSWAHVCLCIGIVLRTMYPIDMASFLFSSPLFSNDSDNHNFQLSNRNLGLHTKWERQAFWLHRSFVIWNALIKASTSLTVPKQQCAYGGSLPSYGQTNRCCMLDSDRIQPFSSHKKLVIDTCRDKELSETKSESRGKVKILSVEISMPKISNPSLSSYILIPTTGSCGVSVFVW